MASVVDTRCCVVGGGPAGMMLGLLLARMGGEVVVLERHADFLRDFRGDTIHPSTLDLMYELGLVDEFLRRPHQEVRELSGQIGSDVITIADFTHLPTHCKFLALMPQWEFLDFLKQHAQRYSGFKLLMNTDAIDLVEQNGTITGVRARSSDGELQIRCALVVGADGRRSVVRQRAGLTVIDLGAPMDVMWVRVSRQASDSHQTFGHLDRGRILVLLNREMYWQAAFVIPKGEADRVRSKGVDAFRQEIAQLAPFLGSRLDEIRDWSDVSLLTVAVDRLVDWARPGVLCIGDAAHAMSPIGGVGINLAIQDAVATANLLGATLLNGTPSVDQLRTVQQRRAFPTRATQWVQLTVQNRIIRNVLGRDEAVHAPGLLKLLQHWPILRRIPARVIGVGFRPEHIRTPDVGARSG
jgi:2-polyprenyl-6-methoxyphenol hydroxylase-like FAD-dependent oxidoreductase